MIVGGAGALISLVVLMSFRLFWSECLDAERNLTELESARTSVQSQMASHARTGAVSEEDERAYERNRLAISNDVRSYHSLLHDSFVDRTWNRLLRFPHRINLRRYASEINNDDEPLPTN